jgi:putative pyoverdin transport system ATP-binding/permease protein
MIVKRLTSALSEILLVRFAQDNLLALTDRLCWSVLRAPLRQMERIGAPRILTVLTGDVTTLAEAIRAVPSLVINGTILVGCGVYLAWLSEGGLLPWFEGPAAAPRTAVVLITR